MAVDLSKNGSKPEPKGWTLELPWKGVPKPRPRVTVNGTYMPKEYTEWKAAVAEVVAAKRVAVLSGPLSLMVRFKKESVEVIMSEGAPPRFGQGDIDNLVGGLMDALQDAGCFKNDIQVARLQAEIVKETE